MSYKRKAELLLILITGFWSISYLFSRICLEELDPLTLNGFRFLLAFAVLGAVYHKNLMSATKESIKYGVIVGVILVVVYIGATYGVKYTSLSNAGFISCLAVIITPIIELFVFRRKPENKLLISLIICTIGLGLLTLGEGMTFAIGDVLCMLCAISYAVDIIVTDQAVAKPEVDPIGMSVIEIGVTGVIFLVLSFIFETPHLPKSLSVWGAALFLGLFCSGIAFVIQTTQQKHSTPSRVALIFTLEPLFSAIIAYFAAGERLLPRAYVGAALMLFSLILMQVEFKKPVD